MSEPTEDVDIENLARAAFLASEFLSLLRATGMPDVLAHDLVRAWYQSELDVDVVWADLSGDEDV